MLAACLVAVRGVWGNAPGLGVDAAGTYWFYDWIRRSVVEGISPFWTAQFYHPTGTDLVATTGFNFVDAYLSIPLQLLFGFPNYLTPFVVVILMGNALAMWALLHALGLSRIAATAGALVFALHPYVLFEVNNGRLTQSLLWFWPLALRELLLMRKDLRWRRPVLAGLFVALQTWTYWFTGHFLLIVGLPVLVFLLIKRAVSLAWCKRLTLAGGVAALLVAPGAAAMLLRAGKGQVPGMNVGHGGMSIDCEMLQSQAWWLLDPTGGLLNLAVPTLVGTLLVLLLARSWKVFALVAATAVVIAAGPMQPLFGTMMHNHTWDGAAVVLPGFIRFLFPYRIWSVLAFISAIALAQLLDRWIPRPPYRAVVALGLGFIIIWPIHTDGNLVHGEEVPVPAYIAAVRRAPGPVLDLPFPCMDESIYHQFLHGQPLMTGMGQGMLDYQPADLLKRLDQHPLLNLAMASSRGVPIEQFEQWPLDMGRPKVRWLVLHLGLYRRSPQVRFCVDGFEGPPDMRLLLRARRIMEGIFGPPAVADQEAAAWDLWNLDPHFVRE